MPTYDLCDNSFAHAPQYHTRRPSYRPSASGRKFSATLRKPLVLDNGDEAGDAANGRSLAHELAVALMPEPSAGSKLLAEELGLEFDEGAEGIDEPVNHQDGDEPNTLAFANGTESEAPDLPLTSDTSGDEDHPPELDPEFDNLSPALDMQKEEKRLDHDMMDVLARDLQSNLRFFGLLQKLDTEFTVERIASDTIRRINETVRDREGQVRELLEYEREFRKLAGEIGGSDALGRVDVLENLINEDGSPVPKSPPQPNASGHSTLETLEEEPSFLHVPDSQVWEADPEQNQFGDGEELLEMDASLSKLDFPPPPPVKGPLSPAKTIPQLAHLRTLTSSFVSSLTICSEQAQVNGAGLTEAARKIRSLKNKIGGLYSEWDSVERSKQRIERWETGMVETGNFTAALPRFSRVDGRKVVQEHLHAFELALADASMKTQAIMAR